MALGETMLQGETGAKDRAEDGANVFAGERPGVAPLELFEHLLLARRIERSEAEFPLGGADLEHDRRPAFEQVEQLGVELIDALAQIGELRLHGAEVVGRGGRG